MDQEGLFLGALIGGLVVFRLAALAGTMAGAAILIVEVRAERVARKVEEGYCDRMSEELDEAIGWIKVAGQPDGYTQQQQDMMDQLIKLGCSKNKIDLNPCGVDSNFFKKKPENSRMRLKWLKI